MLRTDKPPPETPAAASDSRGRPGSDASPKTSIAKVCNQRADARRLLAALEVPDCGCLPADEDALPRPCRHLRKFQRRLSPDRFPLTIRQWAELLALLDAEHHEPPPCPTPALAMSRAARVAVYEQRETAGVSLWHAGDSWRHHERLDALSVAVHRQRNGSVQEDGLALSRRAA
jgi:hypothetical protein